MERIEIEKRCNQIYKNTKNDEEVLAFLRAEGFTKVESLKFFRLWKNIPLGEAKKIVHFSDVWKDQKEADEALQDSFLDTLENDQQ